MAIVVTTDGSARSLRVLRHAAALAKVARRRLVLLQVLDPSAERQPNVGDAGEESLRGAQERRLTRCVNDAGVDGYGLAAVREADEPVAARIMRAAREAGADLLAMDTRGAGALRHAMLGSVAMGVLGQCGLPVLLTGEKATEARRSSRYHLVVTSDGSPAAAEVFALLGPLLAGSRMEVTLVRIYEPVLGDVGEKIEIAEARRDLERMRDLVPAGLPVECVVEAARGLESVPRALLRVACARQASAIAMSTHGHSARRHLLLGSVALGVLAQSPLPVILSRACP
jgi:nucleotide-binding universal stress UspA family protein